MTSYHSTTELGASVGMVFMAKKRYDARSPAARKIVDDNSSEEMRRTLGAAWDEVAVEAREKAPGSQAGGRRADGRSSDETAENRCSGHH